METISISKQSDPIKLLSPIATARAVTKKYNLTPPFDIYRLCEDIGIPVEDVCMERIEEIAKHPVLSALYNHPQNR